MSILINSQTTVLVQGITGKEGSFHTKKMLEYGTRIVAGVTPGRGGEKMEGVEIYETVEEAVKKTQANTSIIFVPAKFAIDALYEAVNGGVNLVICITEGIPFQDMIKVYHYAKVKNVILIGPNCPGLINPGEVKVGIMPVDIYQKGTIGVVSRSGTLTYEVVSNLTKKNFGQSTCVGIGGDPVICSSFVDILTLFEKDSFTKGIVLIGEIGGDEEEEAAKFIHSQMKKPVVVFIAGKTAPQETRMGHAGAIISGGKGTAEEKIKAFEKASIPVAPTPQEVPELLRKELLRKKIS